MKPKSPISTLGAASVERPFIVRRLVVLYDPQGSGAGRARVLDGSAAVPLGRDDESLPLSGDDGRLSRRHCVIEALGDGSEPQGFSVRDLDSRNGTWLNASRVEGSQQLHPGDVLRLGDHCLLYQELSEREAQSLLREGDPTEAPSGRSPQMAVLRQRLRTLSRSNAPVLLTGATGVGKDLVARALHAHHEAMGEGPQPFVAVNCAALSAELSEAELFGHVKGAYTGAAAARAGLIREAHGGTLFLDELGEMPLALQAKLLRVLESFEVRPVGSDRFVSVDVRVIAATNRDLDADVASGHFRGDLFARLMTHQLEVPPLASRRDDILPLFERFSGEERGRAPAVEADAAEALLCHDWPLNVRELRQLAKRLAIETDTETVTLAQLPSPLRARLRARLDAAPAGPPAVGSIPAALLEVPRDRVPSEREFVLVHSAFEGNVSRIATFFQKDRAQIYRWLKRFGLTDS